MCAIGAALAGFLYSVAFVIVRSAELSALFLLLVGLLSTAALVGVYERVKGLEAGFALLGLILAIADREPDFLRVGGPYTPSHVTACSTR